MPWYCWFVLLGEAGSGQAGDRNLICFVLCHDGSRWSGGGWAAAGGEQIWIYFQIMPDGSLVKFTQTRMRSTWWEIYLKKTFYFLFCFLSSMHCIWERSKISWLPTAKLMQQSQKINCCASIWIELQKLSALRWLNLCICAPSPALNRGNTTKQWIEMRLCSSRHFLP